MKTYLIRVTRGYVIIKATSEDEAKTFIDKTIESISEIEDNDMVYFFYGNPAFIEKGESIF